MNMRKLIYILLLVPILMVTSCKKDSEGVSTITYYPDFVVKGSSEITIPTGVSFTDPGVTATENGVQIPVTITISGDYFPYTGSQVDATTPNKYDILYTAKNKDGFNGTASRTVYVVTTGDMVNSIEGLYTSTVVRNNVVSPQYQDLAYVMIRKSSSGANVYEISDAIGGYYDLGRAYGAGYRATGASITANNIATNDFSFGSSFGVGAFGGTANITSFTVDPIAKTISFETDWDAGPYIFKIVLTQVNI
jgi:hypothetical protein